MRMDSSDLKFALPANSMPTSRKAAFIKVEGVEITDLGSFIGRMICAVRPKHRPVFFPPLFVPVTASIQAGPHGFSL